MRNTKAIGTFKVSKVIRPKGKKLFFQRTTNRNGKPVGSMSSNQGYLSVKQNPITGRFESLKIA